VNSSVTNQEDLDASTTGRHVPALDGVRGLAVLTVVFGHLFLANPDPAGPLIGRLLAQLRAAGWVGVDLFFVLSGFLITGILYDTLPDPHFFRNFYARRILRIFPLYYGFFLIGIPLTVLLGARWTPEVWRVLTYTQNLHIGIPPTADNSSWLVIGHFWSLAVEEQFYFFWPLAVFLLRSRRWIAAAAATGALMSLLLRLHFAHTGLAASNPYILYSFTPSRLDGLLIGAGLAMAIRGRTRAFILRVSPAIFACCAVAIAGLAHHMNGLYGLEVPTSTWGFTVLDLGFAALLTMSLRSGGVAQRLFETNPMRFFGRYSYGIYVYHMTVRSSVEKLNLRPILQAATGSKPLALLVPGALEFALTVVAAWLSFRFYESRFLRLKSRFHDGAKRRKLHDFVTQAEPGP
jgi:peptidoglycan/LPS O-acetylase OafA/YrhL